MLTFFVGTDRKDANSKSECDDSAIRIHYPLVIKYTFQTRINDDNPIEDELEITDTEMVMNLLKSLFILEAQYQNNNPILELKVFLADQNRTCIAHCNSVTNFKNFLFRVNLIRCEPKTSLCTML